MWADEAEFKQCGNGSAMNVDLDIGTFRAGPKSGFFANLLGGQAVSSIHDTLYDTELKLGSLEEL